MSVIKVVKKDKSYRVYADDEYYGILYKSNLKELDLYAPEGEYYIEDVSADRLEDIKALVIKRAFDKAVTYVTTCECSSGMIRSKLRLKNFPDYAIDTCINMMYEYNYLNDARFIESYASCYMNTKSRFLIERELRTKGVDMSESEHILDEVYADNSLSDEEIIASLIERKFRGQDLSDEKVKRRVAQFLVRRGFTFDKINNYLT